MTASILGGVEMRMARMFFFARERESGRDCRGSAALASAAQPPFNIVISNVPGAREPLYWRGARLDGNYPMSIALDGQALNITLSNNADNLDFGLVGCRRTVPHLQRLLGHLEDSLTGLEEAVGV